MKFLKKLFKKKNNKKYSEDSFLRTDVIYNTERNIIILVSFTDDYISTVLEFVSSCTLSNIKTKLLQTSYDEVLDELDEDGNEKIISHLKNYLLIGGEPKNYYNIYNNISLSNELLHEVTMHLYNCEQSTIEERNILIKNNILNKSLFNASIKYDEYKSLSAGIFYDAAKTILNRLPDGFNTLDIIDFVNVFYYKKIILEMNEKQNICVSYSFKEIPDVIVDLDKYVKILDGIVEHPSVELLKKLSMPLYMQEDLSDEIISGSLSDQNLDELFLQKYETFRGIADEEVEYEELVDEILEDDEEM